MTWNRLNQVRGLRDRRTPRFVLVLGLTLAAASLGYPGECRAQISTSTDRGVHYRWSQQTPPGMIGSWQLQRGIGPVGYTQPVRVAGPAGLSVDFGSGTLPAPRGVSLTVGQVHRFQITGLPNAPGESLWPTIEIIDRLHPPVGSEDQFPILVVIEPEEIEMARTGALVTKVIYLENPDRALALDGSAERQSVYDVGPNRNPIQVADLFGRPVAILRMGSWVPTAQIGRTARAGQAITGLDARATNFDHGAAVVPAQFPGAVSPQRMGIPLSQARDRVYR